MTTLQKKSEEFLVVSVSARQQPGQPAAYYMTAAEPLNRLGTAEKKMKEFSQARPEGAKQEDFLLAIPKSKLKVGPGDEPVSLTPTQVKALMLGSTRIFEARNDQVQTNMLPMLRSTLINGKIELEKVVASAITGAKPETDLNKAATAQKSNEDNTRVLLAVSATKNRLGNTEYQVSSIRPLSQADQTQQDLQAFQQRSSAAKQRQDMIWAVPRQQVETLMQGRKNAPSPESTLTLTPGQVKGLGTAAIQLSTSRDGVQAGPNVAGELIKIQAENTKQVTALLQRTQQVQKPVEIMGIEFTAADRLKEAVQNNKTSLQQAPSFPNRKTPLIAGEDLSQFEAISGGLLEGFQKAYGNARQSQQEQAYYAAVKQQEAKTEKAVVDVAKPEQKAERKPEPEQAATPVLAKPEPIAVSERINATTANIAAANDKPQATLVKEAHQLQQAQEIPKTYEGRIDVAEQVRQQRQASSEASTSKFQSHKFNEFAADRLFEKAGLTEYMKQNPDVRNSLLAGDASPLLTVKGPGTEITARINLYMRGDNRLDLRIMPRLQRAVIPEKVHGQKLSKDQINQLTTTGELAKPLTVKTAVDNGRQASFIVSLDKEINQVRVRAVADFDMEKIQRQYNLKPAQIEALKQGKSLEVTMVDKQGMRIEGVLQLSAGTKSGLRFVRPQEVERKDVVNSQGKAVKKKDGEMTPGYKETPKQGAGQPQQQSKQPVDMNDGIKPKQVSPTAGMPKQKAVSPVAGMKVDHSKKDKPKLRF